MRHFMVFISDPEIDVFLKKTFEIDKTIELKYYDKAKMWVRVRGGYFLLTKPKLLSYHFWSYTGAHLKWL